MYEKVTTLETFAREGKDPEDISVSNARSKELVSSEAGREKEIFACIALVKDTGTAFQERVASGFKENLLFFGLRNGND